MKVGILTFHFFCNYGAMLQCLALQLVLRTLGIDSEIIDYTPFLNQRKRRLWEGWGLKSGTILKTVSSRWIEFRYAPAMQREFENFSRRYLRISRNCASGMNLSALVKGYDAIIVGSDQIWNAKICFDPAYFGEFGGTYAGKRISYAACCGHEDQPQEFYELTPEWLKRFDFISVRDQFSHNIVHDLCARKAAIVADPTLLLDLEGYCCYPKLPFEEYLLVYSLGQKINEHDYLMIRRIKQMTGLPVVSIISSAHVPWPAPYADYCFYHANPGEWLGLFGRASLICTDSYHGTIFAIKNRKPFIACVGSRQRSARLYDLAERYGVQERLIGDMSQMERRLLDTDIHYDSVHGNICLHTEQSISFLKQSLAL